MIHFLLMVNKQGQTRLAKYYKYLTVQERTTLEGELIRKCLSRIENQCLFLEHMNYKVIYRRYASLYFIIGVDSDEQNELAFLEFIHTLVETLDKYFTNVCELDIMFNIEKAHYILDEMISNGQIVETNKTTILGKLITTLIFFKLLWLLQIKLEIIDFYIIQINQILQLKSFNQFKILIYQFVNYQHEQQYNQAFPIFNQKNYYFSFDNKQKIINLLINF